MDKWRTDGGPENKSLRHRLCLAEAQKYGKTRLPCKLRPTTRECVHLATRGHFRSRDKDGGHTIWSDIGENSLLHANITALCVTETELLPMEVLHCGNGDFRRDERPLRLRHWQTENWGLCENGRKKVCPFTVLSTTYNYISHTRTHIHQNTSGLSRSSVANNDVVTLLHNSLTVRQLYYMNARLLLHSYSEVNLSHSTDDTTRWTIKTLRSVFESSLLFWHFRIVFIVNKCHTHSYWNWNWSHQVKQMRTSSR